MEQYLETPEKPLQDETDRSRACRDGVSRKLLSRPGLSPWASHLRGTLKLSVPPVIDADVPLRDHGWHSDRSRQGKAAVRKGACQGFGSSPPSVEMSLLPKFCRIVVSMLPEC